MFILQLPQTDSSFEISLLVPTSNAKLVLARIRKLETVASLSWRLFRNHKLVPPVQHPQTGSSSGPQISPFFSIRKLVLLQEPQTASSVSICSLVPLQEPHTGSSSTIHKLVPTSAFASWFLFSQEPQTGSHFSIRKLVPPAESANWFPCQKSLLQYSKYEFA
jgi:hypothetical protein